MKTPNEEAADIQAEAQFWADWQGESDCFGTVAKLILLVLLIAQSFWQTPV